MSARAADYFAVRPDRVAALHEACSSWAGTPFRARSAVKGEFGGVDCASFIGAAFLDCGAVGLVVSVPPYTINHAEHSEESMFRTWFESPAARERVRLVDEDEPHLDGDIVFPVVGRCEHHAGIRIGGDVHHIARPSGYCVPRITQLRLHRSRYRLLSAPAISP